MTDLNAKEKYIVKLDNNSKENSSKIMPKIVQPEIKRSSK